jgi:hypothetical protein
MIEFSAPLIEARDYEAFVGLPNNDFPQTFPEWEQRRFQRRGSWLGQNIRTIDVPVSSDEFTVYCRTRGSRYTVDNLYSFVADKRSNLDHRKS